MRTKAKVTGKVLVLRTCDKNLKAYGGFQWPASGEVSAPDWSPEKVCGQGLHGFLWGEGDGSLASRDRTAKWLVCEVDVDVVVDLGGKVKFPRAEVIHCGDQKSATDYLREHGGVGRAVVGTSVIAGDYGTATAGDYGTATAGHSGKATAGDYGTATAGHSGKATAGHSGKATAGNSGTAAAGHSGTATAGDSGTATAGDSGTATAGYNGTATAGDYGTATAGDYGTATAGDYGTATAGNSGTGGTAIAGDYGKATAGDYGTATAGPYGTATAGESGMLAIVYFDGVRYRIKSADVGKAETCKPGVAYRLTAKGKFEAVK